MDSIFIAVGVGIFLHWVVGRSRFVVGWSRFLVGWSRFVMNWSLRWWVIGWWRSMEELGLGMVVDRGIVRMTKVYKGK